MFLASMCCYVWNAKEVKKFERFIVFFLVFHSSLAFFQHFALGLRHDDVEGVFINMGAGGHLAGAVSAIAIFWIPQIKWLPWLIKLLLLVSSVMVIVLSDSKQVIAVLLLSAGIHFWIGGGSLKNKLKIMAFGALSVLGLVILANTMFPGLLVYTQDKFFIGVEQKMQVVPVTLFYFDYWFNSLFGIGPGHSVSRFATMLPKYESLLMQFGATSHPATNHILFVKESQLFSNSVTGSSMFALDFSLAGIFGDLGWLGLISFSYLYFRVWRLISATGQLSKFFLISVWVYGVVFTWLEEPAFMLFLMSYLGYAWQKQQISKMQSRKV